MQCVRPFLSYTEMGPVKLTFSFYLRHTNLIIWMEKNLTSIVTAEKLSFCIVTIIGSVNTSRVYRDRNETRSNKSAHSSRCLIYGDSCSPLVRNAAVSNNGKLCPCTSTQGNPSKGTIWKWSTLAWRVYSLYHSCSFATAELNFIFCSFYPDTPKFIWVLTV
jgi:hypothetical protein